MTIFKELLKLVPDDQIILQGNQAFALGILHAGYTCVEGYPGTPSTEVIDALRQVPYMVQADWSVNEAVALGVAIGCAVAGKDAMATMKVPGLFQAADVFVSSAFSEMFTGAFVLYIATDNDFSSSQYVVDIRNFLKSLYVPVFEPRNHQELYESPRFAADLSRELQCPVVIAASSILAHSESIITLKSSRPKVDNLEYSGKSIDVIPLPAFAKRCYHTVVTTRMNRALKKIESMFVPTIQHGKDSWGIICVGVTEILVRDCLEVSSWSPHILSFPFSNPLPLDAIRKFRESFSGECFLFEEGQSFVEEELQRERISIIGKQHVPTITQWTPQIIYAFIKSEGTSVAPDSSLEARVQSVKRMPSICSGCPYRAIANVIIKLKKDGKISRVFGDIGCSSLLSYEGVFDYSLCMGASESLRQGYVLANHDDISRVVSLIGDSSECHSGLDASRNSQFRLIPGVKVILDNSAVAMTGHQQTPTGDVRTGFSLLQALLGEGISCIEVDAYNVVKIKDALVSSLKKVKEGIFSAIIIKGSCLHVLPISKARHVKIDSDLCVQCGACGVCPSIEFDDKLRPSIRPECSRCGAGDPLCIQACPKHAIAIYEVEPLLSKKPALPEVIRNEVVPHNTGLPDFYGTFRMGIRGVGGQGNLFVGKILAQVVQQQFKQFGNVFKGEVHGMAQKGGAVVSTFSFGNVYSPLPMSGSLDIIMVLERSELFRNQFLSMLHPNGLVLLNERAIIPRGISRKHYPTLESILDQLQQYNVRLVTIPKKYETKENVYMTGILSQYEPFKQVTEAIWLKVLLMFSKKVDQFGVNSTAFLAGRDDSKGFDSSYITIQSPLSNQRKGYHKKNEVLNIGGKV